MVETGLPVKTSLDPMVETGLPVTTSLGPMVETGLPVKTSLSPFPTIIRLDFKTALSRTTFS
jgi:hypothetical protein